MMTHIGFWQITERPTWCISCARCPKAGDVQLLSQSSKGKISSDEFHNSHLPKKLSSKKLFSNKSDPNFGFLWFHAPNLFCLEEKGWVKILWQRSYSSHREQQEFLQTQPEMHELWMHCPVRLIFVALCRGDLHLLGLLAALGALYGCNAQLAVSAV